MTDLNAKLEKAFLGKIDYWLVGPLVTEKMTLSGCSFGQAHQFACVTTKPCYVQQAVNKLRGSQVKVGTTVGYPFGDNALPLKIAAIKHALTEGAQELAIFINLGEFFEGRTDRIEGELRRLIGLTHMNGAITKTVIDGQYFSASQLIRGASVASRSGTDYVYIIFHEKFDQNVFDRIGTFQKSIPPSLHLGVQGDLQRLEDSQDLLGKGFSRLVIFEDEPISST